MKVFVGSGWFSPISDLEDQRKKILGAAITRRPEFHHLWLESVDRVLKPERICIVDNASPRPSPLRAEPRIEWIDLPQNSGHASSSTSRLSGWSESVLLTLARFLESDAELYVYFEQSILVSAQSLAERLKEKSKRGPVLTSGRGSPQPVTAGIFAVTREHAPRFMRRYRAMRHPDRMVSIERKLLASASSMPVGVLNLLPGLAGGRLVSGVARFAWRRNWSELEGGRARPIPWSNDFALKHPSITELKQYCLTAIPNTSFVSSDVYDLVFSNQE